MPRFTAGPRWSRLSKSSFGCLTPVRRRSPAMSIPHHCAGPPAP